MEGPWFFPCWQEEVSSRSRNIASAAVELAVLHDEICGNPVTDEVTGTSGMIHTDAEIFVHLEVEVRGVHSVVVADGADLLTPHDLLALAHHDPVQMAVERVCKMQLSVLNPGMPDHHHVPPVGMDVPRQNDEAIPDGMHGMPECLPFSSGDDPVLSKMTMGTESTGLAKSCSVGGCHWQVESIGRDG